MPGTNSQATAEMALLLIMAASRRLPIMEKACRSGEWRIDKETEESLRVVLQKTNNDVPKAIKQIKASHKGTQVFQPPSVYRNNEEVHKPEAFSILHHDKPPHLD